MRRRFVLAFIALFAVLAAGAAISLVLMWRGTTELRSVLDSHQLEALRQSLSRSIRTSQKDLQVSGTVFASQPDELIANLEEVTRSTQDCLGCHHEPALRREQEKIAELAQTYERQLRAFVEAPTDAEDRQRLQLEAAASADEMDAAVESLLLVAGPALQRRTREATAQVERSWKILVVTVLLTFVVAIAISLLLTRSVTEPLDRLVAATGRIIKGESGFRIRHQERHEIGVLMDAFNAMSGALESNKRRIEHYVEKLFRLNQSVVKLYEPPDENDLFARQVEAIDGLMEVDLRGAIVPTGLEDVFLVSLGPRGETTPKYRSAVSAAKLEKLCDSSESAMLVVQEGECKAWPFGGWAPRQELRNYLVAWVVWQGELRGALVAANRSSGDFEAEDCGLLVALAQAVGEAVDQARDYRSLQVEVEKLRSREGNLLIADE